MNNYLNRLFAVVTVLFFFLSMMEAQIVYTIGGSGFTGSWGDGGLATSCAMNEPWGIARDNAGNIYYSELGYGRVRKIDTSGIIYLYAGGNNGHGGDGGPATSAQITPIGLAVDASGNLFIADGDRIRKVDNSGIITTVAGTGTSTLDGVPALSASLTLVTTLATDPVGNLYLNDKFRIKKIDTNGIITTVAGNGTPGFSGDGGPATSAQIYPPTQITFDNAGNLIYIDANRIRKISTSGTITTIAGVATSSYTGDGGPATSAELDGPEGIAADDFGNIYISDQGRVIRKIDPAGIISTITSTILVAGYNGSGIPANFATLNIPLHLTTDPSGNIYFCDRDNHRVRVICVSNCLAGIEEVASDKSVQVFPNPVSNLLTIKPEQPFEKGTEIEILNTLGQTILNLNYSDEIDVSSLSQGYYTIRLITPDRHQFHSKFLKE